jgi:hypothetical protein
MSEWISVKDRLPEIGKEVLTFSLENGHIFFDCAYVDDDGVFADWFASWSARSLEHVTHWMPLPEPPEPCQVTGKG